ncbi:glycosyl hydrolase 115 family protein [Massilia varians]|uniref:glycosyl hydrolase 115 family protein n=1 Tax=Massilia varians TaxID=457921 RepID=UPI0025531B4B|nr:glycosyl hydrolase 115 family protein [Massilia varians]MDK6078255.1 glycosyl hydrolase 115 family protein [Massilia varians]
MTFRFLGLGLLLASSLVHAQPFALDADGRLPVIVTDAQATYRLAGELLGRDLQQLTGFSAARTDSLDDCRERCIVIGAVGSPLVTQVARAMGVDLAPLAGQQERYIRAAGKLDGRSVLLVAGADRRGAVYGVVDASRELGISPWEWWADVAPRRRTGLALDGERRLSPAPSVAWRGIFINDEDWGLQPWAAKTFDPAKDIGPATYARVFELMWRLKANLVWPAMHDSTRAFYTVPGNAQVADDYAILVGTSHAEPMMRNNVGEWKKSDGPFNFFSNRERLLGYWQERVDEVKGFENVYTLGLRGVHDSAMEGATSPEHARDTVQQVIGLQRDMLARSLGKPASSIPTVFTMYKEVLDYYNAGLKVPGDVSLVWPDDNYGYLHQLGTAKERARPGGNGIYYHISYWGRPHDYLWLGTTHPALIRDQLDRAWSTGARRMWVVNVGDIKPNEYLTQYFLDAAFDASVLRQDPARHLSAWAAQAFGAEYGAEIAAIQQEYYRLAWERRPEFMGWSQTEPTRPVRGTEYVRSGGEEAERRLAAYAALVARAEAIERRLPAGLRDAYFQLVLYPVRSSARLNERILKLDLAAEYALQQRPSSAFYTRQAQEAHAALLRDAAAYNALGGGKWAHMMDIAPRRLPVFAEPLYPSWTASARRGCGLVYPAPHSVEASTLVLPVGRAASRTLTLVSYGGETAAWSVAPGAQGLRAQVQGGRLDASNGYEQRITLDYDGSARPLLALECGGKQIKLNVQAHSAGDQALPGERERIVTLPAGSAAAGSDWEAQPGLGTSGKAMRARLDLPKRSAASLAKAKPLEYRFQTRSEGGATLRFVAVPVHALTSDHRLRIAVQLDDGPLETFDYTTVGRSDEWKQNVLSNMAVRSTTLARLKPGVHSLRVYALDPGVVLDRIDVVLDGAPHYYGMPPSDP